MRRMIAAATLIESTKVLFECGYDENLLTYQPENTNAIIEKEYTRTIGEFTELCLNPNLLQLVLCRFDYHNAILAYNARITDNTPSTTAFYPFGSIEINTVTKSIQSKNYDDFTRHMKEALEILDNLSPTPLDVEVELVRAMYFDMFRHLEKINNRYITNYFRSEIDIQNMRTLIKIGKNTLQSFNKLIIGGGHLDESHFNAIISKDYHDIKSSLVQYDEVINAIIKSTEEKNPTIFENVANRFLIAQAKQNSEDSFSLNMLFSWLIEKLEELRIVKVILMGKKIGKSKEDLRNQLEGVL